MSQPKARGEVVAVFGAGYVGLSLACLLARRHEVVIVDVAMGKVDDINSGASPIRDAGIEDALAGDDLRISATLEGADAVRKACVILVATPTDYDVGSGSFDVTSVDSVVDLVERENPDALLVVKSTVPVGYTSSAAARWPGARILFSPEFLREGKALHDNLHPSRVVVGYPRASPGADELKVDAERFAMLLASCAEDEDVPVLVTGSDEAEAIKLFANTYLATRVAFFNELDTYAASEGLDASEVVRGVALDPRIGDFYNNPSFGYGGYCLPKDTRQLLATYGGIPQRIVKATVESNGLRMDFVAGQVLGRIGNLRVSLGREPVLGIYRLAMKTGSDNHRASSVIGVIERFLDEGVRPIVWDPSLEGSTFMGCAIEHDLEVFKSRCDIIVANRVDKGLAGSASKIYTRDLFMRD